MKKLLVLLLFIVSASVSAEEIDIDFKWFQINSGKMQELKFTLSLDFDNNAIVIQSDFGYYLKLDILEMGTSELEYEGRDLKVLRYECVDKCCNIKHSIMGIYPKQADENGMKLVRFSDTVDYGKGKVEYAFLTD